MGLHCGENMREIKDKLVLKSLFFSKGMWQVQVLNGKLTSGIWCTC